MANPEHVAKLNEGWEAWNAWRKTTDDVPNLSGISLSNFSFRYHNLRNVDLSYAVLHRVTFMDATCNEISFEGAQILFARFLSPMKTCNLSNTVIVGSAFNSVITGSDFTGAQLLGNSFSHFSLRGARGLDALAECNGNSVGIDTFFYSGGLPEVLLRGSGVPAEFIQYASSLVGKAIEYYSCFLSYSSKDDGFARRLYNDLQGKNIRTWFAPEDLKIGDRFDL